MLRATRDPGSWLVSASFASAALSAALVGWWLVSADSSLRCDFGQASSMHGDADRSWLPPGTTCRWTVNGVEHVDRPDISRLAVLAMAAFGAPLGVYLDRLLDRSRSTEDR